MVTPTAQSTYPGRVLAPGDTLGRYELIRQVAVGGMAELFLARTKGIEGFEKLVVVKRILPAFVGNAQFVQLFINEARLAAQLHHPNIAQVFDIGQDGADYFFSMEYVHGEDLGRIIAAATENGVPLSLDAALTLGAGLCAGLHHAHEKAGPDGRPLGIVHRDVSPSNVLVSYDGAVKLVDFGIARATGTTKTTSNGLKGKLAFMSPEQCRGQALDRRSDIYAVGTTLYEMTTGQLPFAGQSAYNLLNCIVHHDVPPPSSLVADYPPALEAIVLRALARDPAQRFASARDLQGALEDYAHESRLRVSPLVLARLMSTLFPARLEEWERARAAGAFFVEQHVVRTLIESGKTGDQTPLAAAATAAAAAAVLAEAPEPESPRDPTSVTQPLDLGELDANTRMRAVVAAGDRTGSNVVPFPAFTPPVPQPRDLDEVIAPPPPVAPVRRAPTPVGGSLAARPSTAPLTSALTAQMAAAEMYEAHAVSAAELGVGDSTELVRPLHHAAMSRASTPRKRWPLFVGIGAGLAVVGIVVGVAMTGGGAAPRPVRAAPAAAPVAAPAAAPVAAPVAAPAPAADPPPAAAPSGAPLPVAPPPVVEAAPVPAPLPAAVPAPPLPVVAHVPVRPAAPPPVKHPQPRPAPRPKDPAAGDAGDGLYMPVRPVRVSK